MCQRLVCQKREFAARSSSCEVSRFIISLQSIFSVVEIIIELLLLAKN